MKKNLFSWMTIMMMVFVCAGFTACGGDDDDKGGDNGGNPSGSGLIGWWMTESWDGWDGYQFCEALHFINDNTVEYYSHVANGKYWTNSYVLGTGDYSASFPGKSGWFYQKDCQVLFTYYMKDNMLYLYNAYDVKIINCFGGSPNGYTKVK